MPKITIKTLPLHKHVDIPRVLKKLGDNLAYVLNIPLNRIVIIWEKILPDHFLFNGRTAKSQERSTHHPIVEVTIIKGMPAKLIKIMVITLVRDLSFGLKIDYDNICVILNTLEPEQLFVNGDFKDKQGHA